MTVTYQPDVVGMRERAIINEVPRRWFPLSKENIKLYRLTIPCLFVERNKIVHKGQEYRFKNE